MDTVADKMSGALNTLPDAPLTGEMYHALFAGADQGFCLLQVIFDDKDRPIDYRYLDVNDAFERQSGLKNAKGKTIREMVPDIDPQWFAVYGNVALTGQSVRYENYIPALHRWFEVFGYRVGPPKARQIGVLFNDNTARKQAEESLRVALARNERIAETLQRSLLLAPAPDAYEGVTIEAVYQSAWDDAQIGGDFFDVFSVDEARVALAVGDATGKGVEAATYTSEIKFALRAFLRVENGAPAQALNRLTDFVARNAALDTQRGVSAYAALALVVLDTNTGEIACACAGAEPPIVLRGASESASTSDTTEVTTFGPLLGVAPKFPYEAERLLLAPGDLLLMTTDGITEARPPRDALTRPFFGLDGLARAARLGMKQYMQQSAAETAASSPHVNGTTATVFPSAPLAQIGAFIVKENNAWAGGNQHDDICLLLVRRQ